MPVPLVLAHVRMLPRLDAEEALLGAERVAVGSGAMTKDGRERALARWNRTAEIRRERGRRPRDAKRHRALAEGAGIAVVVVPAKPKAPDA